jgi:hypothetical protein
VIAKLQVPFGAFVVGTKMYEVAILLYGILFYHGNTTMQGIWSPALFPFSCISPPLFSFGFRQFLPCLAACGAKLKKNLHIVPLQLCSDWLSLSRVGVGFHGRNCSAAVGLACCGIFISVVYLTR